MPPCHRPPRRSPRARKPIARSRPVRARACPRGGPARGRSARTGHRRPRVAARASPAARQRRARLASPSYALPSCARDRTTTRCWAIFYGILPSWPLSFILPQANGPVIQARRCPMHREAELEPSRVTCRHEGTRGGRDPQEEATRAVGSRRPQQLWRITPVGLQGSHRGGLGVPGRGCWAAPGGRESVLGAVVNAQAKSSNRSPPPGVSRIFFGAVCMVVRTCCPRRSLRSPRLRVRCLVIR